MLVILLFLSLVSISNAYMTNYIGGSGVIHHEATWIPIILIGGYVVVNMLYEKLR